MAKRFWSKTKHNYETDCMEWTRSLSHNGYGKYWHEGKNVMAHRYAYESFKGKIPDGMVVDHLCRNRACVNPAHLELVTVKENIRRGDTGKHTNHHNTHKTHCKHGHEFTELNTYNRPDGKRDCKTCIRRRLEV